MDDFYLEEEARCKKNKVPWQWFGHAAAGHAIAQGLQAKDGPNMAAVLGAAALWGTAPVVMGVQAANKKCVAPGGSRGVRDADAMGG